MGFEIKDRALNGVVVISPDVHGDERGFFMESYREDEFRKIGIDEKFVQDNHSLSTRRGIVRGLH